MKRLVILLIAAALARSTASGGEIHSAAVQGKIERVKALLQANADLANTKDDKGQTHQADLNLKDTNERTPLFVALKKHQADIAAILRKNGALEK